MMSHCTACYHPTDLALSDVLTAEQLATYDVPLQGNCGRAACIEKALRYVSVRVPSWGRKLLRSMSDLQDVLRRQAVVGEATELAYRQLSRLFELCDRDGGPTPYLGASRLDDGTFLVVLSDVYALSEVTPDEYIKVKTYHVTPTA